MSFEWDSHTIAVTAVFLVPVTFSIFVYLVILVYVLIKTKLGQKTRDTQPHPRMFVSTVRNRTSISHVPQPSVYVTPANMPPPKYEAMAPPSYEEVVGIHYPTFSQPAPAPAPTPPPPASATSAAATRSDTITVTVASS